MQNFFPTNGYVRLWEVLRVVPVGKTCWYEGIKSGLYPRSVKISKRCVGWKAEDIQILLRKLAEQEEKRGNPQKETASDNQLL